MTGKKLGRGVRKGPEGDDFDMRKMSLISRDGKVDKLETINSFHGSLSAGSRSYHQSVPSL